MMELTTTLIARTLQEAYPDIDWYVNFVPEAVQTLPALPVGRIVEVGMTHDDYASDRPLSMDTTVQVDIWTRTLDEAQSIYYEVDELFMNNSATLNYSEIGHDADLQNCTRIIKRYYLRRDIKLV